MNEDERKLNDWAHEHFRMTLRELQTLAALVSGYRLHELPLAREAIDQLLQVEARHGVSKALHVLETMGLAWRAQKYGKSGNRSTWVPTPRALARFPEPDPIGPVKARVGRKMQRREEERRAG